MSTIKELALTEKDFQKIIHGLRHLPYEGILAPDKPTEP